MCAGMNVSTHTCNGMAQVWSKFLELVLSFHLRVQGIKLRLSGSEERTLLPPLSNSARAQF